MEKSTEDKKRICEKITELYNLRVDNKKSLFWHGLVAIGCGTLSVIAYMQGIPGLFNLPGGYLTGHFGAHAYLDIKRVKECSKQISQLESKLEE